MVGIHPAALRTPGGPSAAAAKHVPWLRRPRLQHEGRVRRAADGAARPPLRARPCKPRGDCDGRGSPARLSRAARHPPPPSPGPPAPRLRAPALVVSPRGARGGYELATAPEQIRMGQVLRALEGP